MNTIIKCDNCGIEFQRNSREIKRSLKQKRKQYCSRNCSGKSNHSQLDKFKGKFNLAKYAKNKSDKYSGFREHLRRIKNRDKECMIGLDYLLEIWELQKGICPYTGVELKNPSYSKKNCKITTASLDRIDSSKGYIKENIQFTSIAINTMKNNMSNEETINLCKIIADKWNGFDSH